MIGLTSKSSTEQFEDWFAWHEHTSPPSPPGPLGFLFRIAISSRKFYRNLITVSERIFSCHWCTPEWIPNVSLK